MSLFFFKTLQHTRRALRISGGFALLAVGVVLLVGPGPGWLVILLGLGLLAVDFIWARRLLDRMKREGVRLRDFVLSRCHARGT
ncbi:MAG: PGPGW domain-containing protein [Candidatus Acidiferrales bacterium]